MWWEIVYLGLKPPRNRSLTRINQFWPEKPVFRCRKVNIRIVFDASLLHSAFDLGHDSFDVRPPATRQAMILGWFHACLLVSILKNAFCFLMCMGLQEVSAKGTDSKVCGPEAPMIVSPARGPIQLDDDDKTYATFRDVESVKWADCTRVFVFAMEPSKPSIILHYSYPLALYSILFYSLLIIQYLRYKGSVPDRQSLKESRSRLIWWLQLLLVVGFVASVCAIIPEFVSSLGHEGVHRMSQARLVCVILCFQGMYN